MGDRVISWVKQDAAAESSSIRLLPLDQLRNLSDEALIGELRKGNGDALCVLFDRCHKLVLSIASKMIRDPVEAEDVLQEVFLEIYRAAGKFDPCKGTAKTWILQYAYHRSLNRRRYLKLRECSSLDDLAGFEALSYSPNGHDELSSKELTFVVRQGLEVLNRDQRETLQLAIFEGLLLKEIAGRKKQSLGNIRHHYYRGLKKLRAFLKDPNGSDESQR